MVIKCINNKLCSTLTLNKEYEVLEETNQSYVILDDKNEEAICKKSRFEVIQDNEVVKSSKATITELSYQIQNDCKNVKDFRIRKTSSGDIRDILIKFEY